MLCAVEAESCAARRNVCAISGIKIAELTNFCPGMHTPFAMSNDASPAANFSSTWLQLWAGSTDDYSIFALSRDGIVMTWNPGGERIQGYRDDEIIGQPFSVFYMEAERASGTPEAALEAAASSGRYVSEG